MKILILGGTQFLGRHLVEAADANGHQVTLFNRGKTNPRLFPEIETLTGDRNGDLTALEVGRWDAAIDTSGYVSAQVQRSARILAHRASQYTFISSISVYRDFSRPDQDESAPVAELPEGAAEVEGDQSSYGARKVLCERAAESSMPGRVLNIRPGIIIGPHDVTGRLEYWIRRIATGGEVLAPGNPDSRLQLIDVRDLAAWIIRLVEQGQVGSFNATGSSSVTFGQLLDACNAATGNQTRLIWIPDQFLLEQGIKPFVDLPFWIPQGAEDYRGFFAINNGKALQAGLTLRPLAETIRDTALSLDLKQKCEERVKQVGLDSERERAIKEAWK